MLDEPFPRPPAAPGRRSLRLLLSPWSRLALLLVVVLGAAGSLLVWDPRWLLDGGLLRLAAGPWTGPAFVLAYALGTLAFVPKPALNLAAGALFGVGWGLPLAVAGTALGAGLAFGLGRWLGRAALRPLLRTRALVAADRQLTRRGFRSVLLLRVVPGVPFAAANYGSAVSGVGLWTFLAATAVGVVPGTAVYVVAGASASSPTSPPFVASMAAVAASGVVGAGATWWRTRRRRGTGVGGPAGA